MTSVSSLCLLALGVSMAASLGRLVVGLGGANRAVALDTITMLAAGFLGVLAVHEDTAAYLNGALVIALVSFLATVAVALFVQHARPGREEEG